MIRFNSFFLLCLLSLIIGCASTSSKKINLGQHPMNLETKITKRIHGQYLLYLPEKYESENQKWPLMLFLHGAGERGEDLELVKTHGPPKIIQNKSDFPFVLISPQCPKNEWWTSQDQLDFLTALLDEIISNYNIDENRVYLTGLSMGGYGTWSLTAKNPNKFAAIAPICGGGDPKQARKIKDVPIWVFHGEKDTTVPIEKSQEMVDALKAAGSNVEFTIYPDAGHDSWTETYNNQKLYEWFLNHSLSKRK